MLDRKSFISNFSNVQRLLQLRGVESSHLKIIPKLPSDLQRSALFELPNIPLNPVDEATVLENRPYCQKGEYLKSDWLEPFLPVNTTLLSEGVTMSGSKFVAFKGNEALLQEKLIESFRAINALAGFEYCYVPFLVNEKALTNTGHLPKFEEDLFKTTEGKYLIPTGEVPLINLFADKILEVDELPLRVQTATPCFRKEAGAKNEDLVRVHQFQKLELVTICKPSQSEREFDFMINTVAESLLLLGLKIRAVLLPPPDLPWASARTCDIEAWLPKSKKWLEVASISNCTCFQARRALIRYRESAGKPTTYAHTLNGTSIAPGRVLTVLEEMT